MIGRPNPVISLKSAASLFVILAACLALLLPLSLFTPPRDSEVWLFQIINEMQDQQHYVPVLNAESVPGQNPLTLTAMSFLPIIDISTPRLVSCMLGCILISCIFLYSLALFDLSCAFASSLVAMTSLGFLALFGTLNLMALPVALAVSAFGLFSLVYLKGLHSGLYILSYMLAGLAALTGGYFMLVFFLLGALLLILLDLAPSQIFSIHLIPGLVIIACAMAAYFTSYRIILGPGFSSGAFSPGGHIGLFRGMYAVITYSSPWIFLVIPAWVYGGGPSDQDAWRTLLPLRIAIVLIVLMLWSSSSGLNQYATILAMFASPLIGRWISHALFPGVQKGRLGYWMMAPAGLSVFLCALVLLLLPVYSGFAINTKQLIVGAGFVTAAILFIILTVKHKMTAQFIVALFAVVSIVWYMAFLSPEDQWDQKMSYMEGISKNTPLIVYEDDLVMRGYMSAVDASPMIVNRDVVPLNDTAFLAASTSDLAGLIEGLKGRMHSVVVDSYRAENTYALVMVSPKRKFE
jgi:hypothetical protein